jgi:predicted PurR-regulated permease PerM
VLYGASHALANLTKMPRLGALFGILGLALATPLAAAAIVPLRRVFGADDEDPAQG